MEAYIAHLWSLIGLATVLRNLLPPQVVEFVLRLVRPWLSRESSYSVLRVPQYEDGRNFGQNVLYEKVSTYVSSLEGLLDTENAHLSCDKDDEDEEIGVGLGNGESVQDEFLGVKVSWRREAGDKGREGQGQGEAHSRSKCFELTVPKNHKRRILQSYLKHVLATAKAIEAKKRELRLCTNGDGDWSDLPFNHPATFETMALGAEIKERIVKDLDAFVQSKAYFRRVGRAWKRGYLFYGPPGTGKSSMIAAMANYLRFDIYDLEISKVWDNSELRSLLTSMGNKSILVIEDIDCTSVDLSKRDGLSDQSEEEPPEQCKENGRGSSSKVTLSGILNFIDGLWSSCGDERILVFTTNNKGRLDPALLRPGRMDVHIYFPPCSFSCFKMLAQNYLGLEKHEMFGIVEEAFAGATVPLTPAQIGEMMLSNDCPEAAFQAVIAALQSEAKP